MYWTLCGEILDAWFLILAYFLDILQIRQTIPSVWRDILYKSSKPKTKHTDIVFIGDKLCNAVLLNTRAIYNVLTDKKKRALSCIDK